ncbi:MAG TPA: hypothetical protein IAC04_08415 [Candidatus Coprenecus stercoravium]|uniref:Uncharacterized protein n=1 Tax=Candidatus Coprenecus stercoravium TaxID=2840735 RepID=A0A9D2GSN7_9BACT|nr:hypothetical protein [Candidatus Coprenecus stercoravium]
MRNTIITILLALVLALPLSAQERQSRYEGSVSLSYTYMVSVGLTTVHGARLLDDWLFLGGSASMEYGFPDGASIHAGFRPRWFFVRGTGKVDAYLGVGLDGLVECGPWRGSWLPPGDWPERNYNAGLRLIPEIGVGFKLKNGGVIDLALVSNVNFILYDSWTDVKQAHGHDTGGISEWRPGLSIGYRF